jgi:hypothetical protein
VPDFDSTKLVSCDSLGEARELSTRIRAGLPVPGSDAAAPDAETASRRLAATKTPLPLAARRLLAGPGSDQVSLLNQRLDRLEQALASAGTFA